MSRLVAAIMLAAATTIACGANGHPVAWIVSALFAIFGIIAWTNASGNDSEDNLE